MSKSERIIEYAFVTDEEKLETLKHAVEMFLCPVNAITAQHRHGQKPRDKDLTRLCNKQLDIEELLRSI